MREDPRRCIGQTDISLDDAFKEDARLLGEWLRAQYGGQSACLRIAAGTTQRAAETAALVMAGAGDVFTGDLLLDSGFNEVYTGTWEGRTFEEIRRQEPEAYAERGASLGYFRFPGGESMYEAGLRFEAALRKAIDACDRDLVVVSHSGVIRSMVCRMLGLSADDFMTLEYANLNVTILLQEGGELRVEKTGFLPETLRR